MITIAFNEKEFKRELREIDKLLGSLPVKFVEPVLKAATSKAMTPVAKAMRAELRSLPLGGGKRTGALSRSIGKKSKARRSKKTAYTIIGPRSRLTTLPDGTRNNPANYGHIVDGGRKAGGWHRGSIRGINKIGPMWKSMRGTIIANYIKAARPAIAKVVARANKKKRR